MSGDKPPYYVPTMQEVYDAPDAPASATRELTLASTFTGAGGSSAGFRLAGFDVVYANEFVEAARETYAANFPDVSIDERDIREVSGGDICAAAGDREIDVLEGSPPCAAFSQSGKLNDSWNQMRKYSDTEQRVDDLFFEYARILKEVRPKTFVAENVASLATGVSKGYFKMIRAAMMNAGYVVRVARINAMYLGCATSRERLIFLGVRRDLAARGVYPRFPKPLPHTYSFGEALEFIGMLPGDEEANWHMSSQKRQMWEWARRHRETFMWKAYKALYGRVAMYNHRLCLPDKPIPTITQGAMCLYHFDEPRSLSIGEIKRCMTFPQDFVVTGERPAVRWERIGRAVPPLMMKAIAEEIAHALGEVKSAA